MKMLSENRFSIKNIFVVVCCMYVDVQCSSRLTQNILLIVKVKINAVDKSAWNMGHIQKHKTKFKLKYRVYMG